MGEFVGEGEAGGVFFGFEGNDGLAGDADAVGELGLGEVEFGAEHAEAGAYLLGLWGFSDTVVEAIALYHTPAKSAEIGFGLPGLLHVADQLALEVDPRGHEAEAGGLDMDYLASLELAPRVDAWREAWPRTGLDPGAAS